MILQIDKRLNHKIQEYGCYFMSLLWFVNKYTNFRLDCSVINNLYDSLQDVKHNGLSIIDENCYINNSTLILKTLGLCADYTGVHESKDYICKDSEFEILCLNNGKMNHFVAGDGKGNITYNPMGVSEGFKLKSKRIFRRCK